MTPVAINYLLCPAGSASVERAFSCANTIVTNLRTSLSFEKAIMINFIKFNHKTLQELLHVGKIQVN